MQTHFLLQSSLRGIQVNLDLSWICPLLACLGMWSCSQGANLGNLQSIANYLNLIKWYQHLHSFIKAKFHSLCLLLPSYLCSLTTGSAHPHPQLNNISKCMQVLSSKNDFLDLIHGLCSISKSQAGWRQGHSNWLQHW